MRTTPSTVVDGHDEAESVQELGGAGNIQRDTALRAAVGELLGKRWAPEQVAHELRELFPDTPARWLCTESIYQAIYDPDVALACPAKRRRRRGRRRVQGLERRGRLAAMTMIAERPGRSG